MQTWKATEWVMRLIRTQTWTEMKWVTRFSLIAIGALVAIFVVGWVVVSSLGLDRAGTISALLGILFTAALGFGLMGLVFYSNRSGQDEVAGARPSEPRK